MNVSLGHSSVKLFDAGTLAALPVFAFDGHSGNVTALGFNHDGSWVYTGGEDETVKTWDIRFVCSDLLAMALLMLL